MIRLSTYIVTGAFICVAGLSIYMYVRGVDTIHAAAAEARTLQEDVAMQTQKDTIAASLKKTLRAFERENIDLDLYFAREGDAVAVITAFEEMGKTVGAEVKTTSISVRPDKDKTKNEMGHFELVMSCSGTFSEVAQWLALLDTSTYTMQITRVEMTAGENEWVASLTITIPFIKNTRI